MTARLEGFSNAESDEILAQLYEIAESRQFIYEHKWRLGDLIMWDNRCTMHRAACRGFAAASCPAHDPDGYIASS